MENKLVKYSGLLWEVFDNFGEEYVGDTPLCPNDSCLISLDQKIIDTDKTTGHRIMGWRCFNCEKDYPCPGNNYQDIVRKANKRLQGNNKIGYKVYSLDLPPTKVMDEAEDENYWVQARISEKGGKRMAVIYFGERIKGKQDKKSYSQIFLDIEDEQLRFDKNNKNPMKLLCKLTAEFPDSNVTLTNKAL